MVIPLSGLQGKCIWIDKKSKPKNICTIELPSDTSQRHHPRLY